jgi:hypothetical protein
MNRLSIFLLLILILGCRDKTNRSGYQTKWFDTDTLLFWDADAETQTRKRIFTPADSISLIQPVVNGINRIWPEPQLTFKQQTTDTLHLDFKNPLWLTEQSGDAGSEEYFYFAAMNLLEIKGVKVVCFDVPTGSHATSTCWKREDFSSWKKKL